MRAVPRHDLLMLMGDFNAKVGREEAFRSGIGRHSLRQISNDNRIRLASLAFENGLVVAGTIFEHNDIHMGTWTSPNGRTVRRNLMKKEIQTCAGRLQGEECRV